MANHNISGRNDENRPSWRPQDEERGMRGEDTEHHGQGQSGYGAGRYQEDRSFGRGNRNQSYGGRSQHPGNTDDRFSGRGGQLADEDRAYGRREEHLGYGREQGFTGYGGSGSQSFRSGGGRNYDQSFAGRAGFDRGSFDDRPMNRGGGGLGDRGQWNSYSRDEDLPSYGLDQTMYGQGARSQQMNQGRAAPVGQHRGKGPKGYQRSDERIRESACEALEHDEHIDATHIEVVVKNGEVMLTGTVDDRATKRAAEDCIAHLPGVRDVQNSLRVQGDRGRSSSNNNGNGAYGHDETDAVGSQTGGSDKKARA